MRYEHGHGSRCASESVDVVPQGAPHAQWDRTAATPSAHRAQTVDWRHQPWRARILDAHQSDAAPHKVVTSAFARQLEREDADGVAQRRESKVRYICASAQCVLAL